MDTIQYDLTFDALDRSDLMGRLDVDELESRLEFSGWTAGADIKYVDNQPGPDSCTFEISCKYKF